MPLWVPILVGIGGAVAGHMASSPLDSAKMGQRTPPSDSIGTP